MALPYTYPVTEAHEIEESDLEAAASFFDMIRSGEYARMYAEAKERRGVLEDNSILSCYES